MNENGLMPDVETFSSPRRSRAGESFRGWAFWFFFLAMISASFNY